MLRIHAINGFRVEVGEEDRTPAAFDRAAALLAWLALNPGLHARSSVAARFWPDVLDESARASLRSALWALRRQLGEEANGAIVATRDRVGLGDGVWVDVAEAERLRVVGLLEEALELSDGELLPGFEDEWASRPATSTVPGPRQSSSNSPQPRRRRATCVALRICHDAPPRWNRSRRRLTGR